MQPATAPIRIEVSSAEPERQPALQALVDEIRREADAFVFLSGGAWGMTPAQEAQLIPMLDALGMVAKEWRIAVGDGGTKAGMMRAAGRVRSATGDKFLLVGVAPADKVTPAGSTPVDPNHSHIIAVRSADASASSWQSATATMYWVFGRLAAGRPSITVIANGGDVTLDEIEANVHANRRMILIEGSGRAADALVALLRGTSRADEGVDRLRTAAEARRLGRRPDLYCVVPLSAGAAGLRDAILKELENCN